MVIKLRERSVRVNNDKVFDISVTIGMFVVAFIFLLPLLSVLALSFSSPDAILAGEVGLFPVGFDVSGYTAVFSEGQIWIGFRNTILYTIIGTVMQVAIELLAAYPLSRSDFIGRKPINIILTLTMYIGGGMIPLYLMVSDLGILDTWWAIVLPCCCSVYTIIVTRTYIVTSIPKELQEAARIDGCGDWGIFRRVILPLSRPIIFVAILFGIVCYWNSYFSAVLYLQSSNLYPLQKVLQDFVKSGESPTTGGKTVADILQQNCVAAIVASLPLLVAYPFFQKYFEKGMTMGGVKG